ncbi:hypothetical protein DFJ73DRAFT_960090 [Zopfochytrium polystomum]|nr:hypothetical protein DFJ73DRAFT_960090 [Zopfochytrium polystomum]
MTTASATQQTLAVVAGVGPGIGAAVARAFAARGHAVALLAREFSTFAAQKFAIRALSQSLAREFGPRGVHVVHAVMEGLVAGEKVDRVLGPATVEHSRIEPESVARAYVYAAEQDRSAWTQEMDLRPFAERF